jgi:hypothetical protein
VAGVARSRRRQAGTAGKLAAQQRSHTQKTGEDLYIRPKSQVDVARNNGDCPALPVGRYVYKFFEASKHKGSVATLHARKPIARSVAVRQAATLVAGSLLAVADTVSREATRPVAVTATAVEVGSPPPRRTACPRLPIADCPFAVRLPCLGGLGVALRDVFGATGAEPEPEARARAGGRFSVGAEQAVFVQSYVAASVGMRRAP